jgi:Tfp pilus assembly protein PilF
MSLLLEALKKAESAKREGAARRDARPPADSLAMEPASKPSADAEPFGAYDLSELSLAPPRETAQEEEPREMAFPEISLPEAEPANTPDAAAPLEIPSWEPPAPEAPAIALSMDLAESPAGKKEPLLTLDFPQAEALPEQEQGQEPVPTAAPLPSPTLPEPAFRLPEAPTAAPEAALAEQIAAQPRVLQTDGEPHRMPMGGGLPPSSSVTEVQSSGPSPLLQENGTDRTSAATPPQPLALDPVTAPPTAAEAAASRTEAAKKILAASRGKPVSNPRLLGGILLVSILIGAAGYYYYEQTLSQPGIAFRMPPPAAPPPAGAPPATSPEEIPAAPPTEAPRAPEQSAPIAGQAAEPAVATPETLVRAPKKKTAAKSVASPSAADAISGSVAPAAPPLTPPGEPARPLAATRDSAADSGIKIRRDAGESRLDPLLAGAWQAYMAGDMARAENDYRRVLKQHPNSRDALLGLAAIASGRGLPDEAAALYQKILQLDPRDAAAQAGLIGLRGYSDPNASESRLKTLLGQTPDAGYLHFALGNLYAHQSRWPEAQEAYFNALHSDAGNADYAFNLAVSLDHLDQRRLALEYYQRALDLAARGRVAAFDAARVKIRILELLPPQG